MTDPASGAGRRWLVALLVLLAGLAAPAAARPATVAIDRWVEMDLYWFDPVHPDVSADAFWSRYAPLYRGVFGYRGVVLGIGGVPDYILSFSGDPRQRIPLPDTGDQELGFPIVGQLDGDTAVRQRAWRARFVGRPPTPQSITYGPWTYRDLRRLTDALRARARRDGVRDFRVASFTVGVGQAYTFKMPFIRRHPEAFTKWASPTPGDLTGGSYIDPANAMHADPGPLAAFPAGVPEGLPVHRFFAAQWGALAKAAGLDGLLLRDAFGFARPETRYGPNGAYVANAAAADRMTGGMIDLLREVKQAAPGTVTMMWSSAATAISDWRANGLDLERVARAGDLDVLVDETWAGAWGEAGVRAGTFWNAPILGWTYQLGYLLEHAAMLAGTRVRHYSLVDTFDAWESWDTIHTARERLRWGIWAYSHAGVKTPYGLLMPAGSYVSWGHHGHDLLDADAVAFLATEMDAAARDAARTVDIAGPTVVYSRDAMAGQLSRLGAGFDPRDLTDEQVGSVIKWPVPILSITRAEWVGRVRSDLFLFGATTDLPPGQLAAIGRLAKAGQPMSFFGAVDAGTNPTLAALLDVTSAPPVPRINDVKLRAAPGPAWPEAIAAARQFDAPPPGRAIAAPPASVVYTLGGGAGMVLATDGGRNLSLWDPVPLQDYWYRPLKDLMNGDPSGFAVAGAVLDAQLARAGAFGGARVDVAQSGTVAAWTLADGTVRLLAGNLEEGLRDDAERSRTLDLSLPAGWAGCPWRADWPGTAMLSDGRRLAMTLPPEGSALVSCPARR